MSVKGHQCLSATSPLGTSQRRRHLQGREECHQCLSATSPLGTYSIPWNCKSFSVVTNAFRQRVHLGPNCVAELLALASGSPMPFGNESTWDILIGIIIAVYGIMSPMPFGNESTWDRIRQERFDNIRASPMPFGNESTWDQTRSRDLWAPLDVTNAFRQRVHLGLNSARIGWKKGLWVTNAFRQRVHLGRMRASKPLNLESPMPFGNESTWDQTDTPIPSPYRWVTNAFRQRVHLGPAGGVKEGGFEPVSPMPFGNESTWDTRDSLRSSNRTSGHQCLSATSPLGTRSTYLDGS